MIAPRCVGALMAGGTARRFDGAPKGLAVVGGLRIADRVMAALREATDLQLVVANDERAARWFRGARIVPDDEAGVGPLAGLRSALAAADGAAVIVVAWDMPFVSGGLLSALRALGESGASAVAPVHGEPPVLEPLCAYYSPAALEQCDRLLALGERRAGALFDALPGARQFGGAALAALGDPDQLLCSVDTPDALAALGGKPPAGDDAARR
ncbi:MAG: Molybdopterin-guanine dinucleotide biosynthesis protein [Gemmatimonadetes bacterium]|nr:Molybdopterin-guanine dinucleotide biosynthesis protein [Gemmatimonadota bacterium]